MDDSANATTLKALSVLNVSHNYYIEGGTDRCFLELEDVLSNHGHRVIPFCAASPHNKASPFDAYFPRSFSQENPTLADGLRFIYSPEARANMRRLLDDQSVDLAHLHIYYGKLTSSILAPLKDRGIPIVQSLHEYKLLCPVYTCISDGQVCEACGGKQFWNAAVKKCNRGSLARSTLSAVESYVSRWLGAATEIDHFIGVSGFMTQKMIETGIPPEKISTIHNYVNADNFTVADEPGKYVLYFGRIEAVKGLVTLLDAMRQLPDVELRIAGSGNQEAELRAYAEQHKLNNVKFVGFVGGQDLHELVRGSLCTVTPSEWYENCPMSVLESLAMARPVIGSRMGGIPELIRDGEDGIVFEAGDAEALAASIKALAEDPELAMEFGRAGRARVERDFSAAHFYEQLTGVYSKLLA